MLRFLIAALAASGPVTAGPQMVYQGETMSVTLMLADCDIPALANGLRQVPSLTPPKMAVIRHGPTEIPACWGTAEDKVLLGDILGNAGFIPMDAFKAQPGT
jgi:hypothetical protein